MPDFYGGWLTLSRDLHSWFHNSRHSRANSYQSTLLPVPTAAFAGAPSFVPRSAGRVGWVWVAVGVEKSAQREFQIRNWKFQIEKATQRPEDERRSRQDAGATRETAI
jgi:hypothetical protein